jgi:flagellar M-ring protein FliF
VLNFDKNDMMRVAELAVLLVMAAMVVFFVVRPLLTTAAGGGMPSIPLLVGAAGGSAGAPRAEPQITLTTAPQPAPAPDGRIDIARIEGQVKASSVKQVSEFVESHPEESVSILRAWLHESA